MWMSKSQNVHFQCFSFRFQEVSRSFQEVPSFPVHFFPPWILWHAYHLSSFFSIIFGPDFNENPRAPCCLAARWDFQTLAEGGAVYWPSCICTANDLNLVCKTYCWRAPYTREIEQPCVFSMVCWSFLSIRKREIVMIKRQKAFLL